MKAKKRQVHIVVPIYNEERYLERSITRLMAAFSDSLYVHVYLVDDHSSDRSPQLIQKLVKTHPGRVSATANQFGKGKGGAIRTALSDIEEGIVAIHDADLEYSPSDLALMISSLIEGGSDTVFGSRLLGGNRFLGMQRWQNQGLAGFARWILPHPVTDIATCYKVFDVRLVKGHTFYFSGFGFDFELAALLLKRTSSFLELPISFTPRTVAQGKKLKPWHGISAVFALLFASFYSIDR